jgi:hypothetical protein
MMKAIGLVLLILVVASSPAVARQNGALPVVEQQSRGPAVLPTNGLWHYSAAHEANVGPDGHGGWMSAPSQADLWTVESTNGVTLSITDAWITGDRFEVYVDGVLVLTTPVVWFFGAPEYEPDTPGPAPFEHQEALNAAFRSAWYSSGAISIGSGTHLINVKDIRFPPDIGGAAFGLRAVARPSAVRP